MWSLYAYVAVGGAVGAMGRFLVMNLAGRYIGKDLPYGTFTVNILGSFLLGVMIAVIALLLPRNRELHAMISIGALGAFTTFSTFAMDLYLMMERGQWVNAGLYSVLSVIASVLAFLFGMWVLRSIVL